MIMVHGWAARWPLDCGSSNESVEQQAA